MEYYYIVIKMNKLQQQVTAWMNFINVMMTEKQMWESMCSMILSM